MAIQKSLRVAIVVNNLDVGGLEKVAINLIRLLRDAGHAPHLICLDGPGKLLPDLDLPSAQVLVLKKQGWRLLGRSFDPGLLFRIRRFVISRHIEILHAHNLAPLAYAALSARLFLLRRPMVVYSEHNQLYSASASARQRFSQYIGLVDHVIAVSHDLRRELVEVLKTTRPVTVVHNGIDAPIVDSGARQQARELIGAGDDDLVFGMVAVLSKQKGITYLLQAARTVLTALPRARLVIVGDGPLREELIRERDQLGLTDQVTFTGYRSDIPRMMAGFDIYVQSSLWEGLPIVLIEALAAGKPIVATSVGGNPEVVEHEVNGLIAPPADAAALAAALLRIAGDSALRAAAADRNRKKFERQFASQAMLNGHLSVYAQALAPGR